MATDKTHPLYQIPRPIYWVPPIEPLGSAINRGIEYNRHGLICEGLGRIGKSEGLLFLLRTTDWREYNMTAEYVMPGKPKTTSEYLFFSQLSLNTGLGVRASSPSPYVVNQYANHLCELASLSSSTIILVAIDDANRLKREDYDHLVTLDSHVSRRGYRLFVVLMLQEDADQSDVPVSATLVHPSQITGRFTADRMRYTGLQGAPHIQAAFDGFLKQSWQGSTYLEEFAPSLLKNGWKSVDLATDFWNEVRDLRAKVGLDPDAPFPMQAFDPASYHLFGRLSAEGFVAESFSIAQINESLKLSGLIELELSRSPREYA